MLFLIIVCLKEKKIKVTLIKFSFEMTDNQSDLLKIFFEQTHLGKMSLITLMQNLPDKILPTMSEIIYDENSRYLKLKDYSIKKNFLKKSITHIKSNDKSINNVIRQCLPNSG